MTGRRTTGGRRPVGPVLWLAHRLTLRTSQGPIAPLWHRLARLLARGAGRLAARGERDVSVYARGGIGRGDFVPGLSDIDMIVVVGTDAGGPGVAAERVRRAWRRVGARSWGAVQALGEARVLDDAELGDLVGTTSFTYGLGSTDGRGRAAYRPDPSLRDRLRMLERPGLYGDTDDWLLLSGRERRPAEPPRDPQERRVAAWLELGFYWRLVFPTLLAPSRPRTPLLCVKLVSEPARIWLWLAHGERAGSRRDALERMARWLPEEAAAASLAIDLERSLGKAPEPPLADALAALVRLSERIASLVVAGASDVGTTSVRLTGVVAPTVVEMRTGPPATRQLCDWRALVVPAGSDEHVVPMPGDPGDPVALREATLAQDGPTYRALRSERLIVLPAALRERVRLRAVNCAATDPVSFALADGLAVASFPDARGWSVGDVARRAIAEHRPRLRGIDAAAGDRDAAFVTALTAARAALVHDAVESGEPVIPVTLTATAELLAQCSPAARAVADEAVAVLHARGEHGRQPSQAVVAALRRVVSGLEPYRDAPWRS